MNTYVYIIVAVILWNIVTFSLYGIDKDKARRNKWRISEVTLITCSFLMGSVGALLGMRIFRHKTKHLKFKLLIPLALIINIGITACILYFVGMV